MYYFGLHGPWFRPGLWDPKGTEDERAPGNSESLCGYSGLWSAGNDGMEKEMETTFLGYTGTTIRIHSFIPRKPKASIWLKASDALLLASVRVWGLRGLAWGPAGWQLRIRPSWCLYSLPHKPPSTGAGRGLGLWK